MPTENSQVKSIAEVLSSKSTAKQEAFRSLKHAFEIFESQASNLIKHLLESENTKDEDISLEVEKLSDFEFHLTVAGDVIIFIMHSNIVTFDDQYAYNKTAYVSEDINRRYLGQINIYNFMADSVRYNRVNDPGYLVARLLINREGRFFVEGDQRLNFLYKDISAAPISEDDIGEILHTVTNISINHDLIAPPFSSVRSITVGQKNIHTQSMGGGNKIGFQIANSD